MIQSYRDNMPKEIQEIKNFHTGTIMTPSSRDIPIDASRYAKNIDSVSEDGKLKGIPSDLVLKDDGTWMESPGSTSPLAVDIDDDSSIINKDGQYDIVYYDKDSNDVRKIVDLYELNGNIATSSMGSVTNSTDSVTMEVNNKEVHIGMGKGADDVPKWAGYIEHTQFGVETTALTMEDAGLNNPSVFPEIYQFVEVTFNSVRYLYGISYQGKYVYQFDFVQKRFIKHSQEIFTSTQGICVNADDDALWVVDVDSGGNATVVHSVDLDKMISQFSISISHNAYYSDVVSTGLNLWFSWMGNHSEDYSTSVLIGNSPLTNFVSTASGTKSVIQRGFFRGDESDSLDVGDWVNQATHDGSLVGRLVEFRSPKTNLIDVGDDDYCGIMLEVQQDVAVPSAVFFRYSASTSGIVATEVKNVIGIIGRTISNEGKLDGKDITSGILTTLADSTDFVAGNPTWFYHSCTAFQTGKLILSYGDDASDTSTTNIAYWTMKALSAITNGSNLGEDTRVASLDLPVATVMEHATDNYSYFAGRGGGRWAYDTGGTPSTVTVAQEADVSLSFTKTATDFDTASSGTFVSGARKGFNQGMTLFYKVSFMYDGYQEGPLSDDFRVKTTGDLSVAHGNGVNVHINFRNLATFSKRISHINLYRAHSTTDGPHVTESGFYRIVDQIELNSGWAENTDSADNPTWGNYRSRTVIDKNVAGASFEARTGITEALLNFTPNYTLSTQLNNQHFVADCYHPDLGDEFPNIMFKSQPYNFDQFDVTMDLLRLPTKPRAIVAFSGRIYAFSKNHTYRIEPNQFYIEDTFEGIGCFGKSAIAVSDYGMCFCDEKNIYLHDGRRPIPIGNAILKQSDTAVSNTNVGWQSANFNTIPTVLFDSERNSFIVLFRGADDNYYAWAYNLQRKRWDLYDAPDFKSGSSFVGPKGELLIPGVTNNRLYHYLGSTTVQRDWHYETKNISLGSDTQKKMFYKIKSQKDADVGINYQKNGTGSWLTLQTASADRILSTDKKFESIAIKIFTHNQADKECDSIGIIYRRLPIK